MSGFRLLPSVLLAALVLASVLPSTVAAAGSTFYVDGKNGSDSRDGLTPATAFKTIAHAASALPAGSGAAGWKVSVKGYTDYVYRERAIPAGWNRRGASGAPIVFQATGYVAGSSGYVKPIVSGADIAPSKGQTWTSSGTTGVWKTPWPTKPFGYGSYTGPLRTALFQDGQTWLWEQSSMSALAGRAKIGRGGYLWSNGYLYATAVGSPSAGTTSPARHTIDVIMRLTFFFEGYRGVSHLEVRGFEVRHSGNGIAFAQGTDYAVAADNVVTGNQPMGIGVSGRLTSTTADPAIGVTITRNTGSWNTLQAVKLDQGTQSARVCDNTFTHDGLQGIKVQGPRDGSATSLPTKSVTICNNRLSYHDLNPTGSQYNNANGLTIANGARDITVDSNRIYGNDVGIHVTQETTGRARMDGVTISRNDIHDNRRFGVFFYDGANGSSAGAGSMHMSYDRVWANGIGIEVGRGSTNKHVSHATVYDNVGTGVRIGEGGQTGANAAVGDSLVTHNGGYGLEVVSGNKGSVSYTGFSLDALGATRGTMTKTGINTKAAGYLSTTTSSVDFLRIATTSYQYTAGSKGGPVGAKY